MIVTETVPSEVLGATVETGEVHPALAEQLPMLTLDEAVVRVFADQHTALIEVPEVGRYLVADGRRIVIDPIDDPAPSPTVIRTWLHGTVLSMLLGQQQRFALHASVVEIEGVRVAIAGVQKAGKSTTSLAVSLAGGSLVSDDVAVLDPGPLGTVGGTVGGTQSAGQTPGSTPSGALAPGDTAPAPGRVNLVPFGRSVHVWVETAHRLGIDIEGATKVASGFDKVSLPPPDVKVGPLDGVIILRADDDVAEPRLVQLSERIGLVRLRRHTYRPQLVEMLWPRELFAWQATLARRLPVAQLIRPTEWSVDAVVDTVIEHARSLRTRA